VQPIIDSHCHLDDERFSADLGDVVRRAAEAGVCSFVVPAVTRSGWGRLLKLTTQFPRIYPAYGMHPWFCDTHDNADIGVLQDYLNSAVAIGECGLDFGKGRAEESEQLKWFRVQLELAEQYDKPVILHAYKAVDTVLRELKRFPNMRGVMHGFSGSAQQAEHLLDHGFYLGIGGGVTYPQAKKLKEIVRTMPTERLLLESDAPDQPPYAFRGKRNEPAWLTDIIREIAGIKGMEKEELIRICNNNAKEMFQL